jgi:hypothetical protein
MADFLGGRYWDRTSGPCRVKVGQSMGDQRCPPMSAAVAWMSALPCREPAVTLGRLRTLSAKKRSAKAFT